MSNSRQKSFREGVETKLGGFAGRLGDWKKNGSIVIFIQTSSGLTPRLFHLIPYVGEDDKGKKVIRFYAFVCHEDPEHYSKQMPAQHCPIDRAIDILIDDGRIDEDEIIWDASIGNRNKDRVANKLDFCQIDKTADWRNSFKPAVQYIFVAVDVEKVSEGLVVAVEPQTVGQSISACVTREIDSQEGDEGDPEINPYAFKLTYDPDALPKDKYDAYAFRKAEYTDEIRELIESNPIDLSNWINPGNSAKLRKHFEAHFKADIDLDILFDNVLDPENYEEDTATEDDKSDKLHERTRSPIESTRSDDSTRIQICNTCNGQGIIGKKKSECPDCEGTGFEDGIEPAKEEEQEPDTIECKLCGGIGTIGKKKTTCPDCDGIGSVEIEEEKEPPSPKKSGTKKSGTKKSGTKKPSRTSKPKPPPEEVMVECGSCHRKIPETATICPFCYTEFEEFDEGDD